VSPVYDDMPPAVLLDLRCVCSYFSIYFEMSSLLLILSLFPILYLITGCEDGGRAEAGRGDAAQPEGAAGGMGEGGADQQGAGR
jgi:hypothetical protein